MIHYIVIPAGRRNEESMLVRIDVGQGVCSVVKSSSSRGELERQARVWNARLDEIRVMLIVNGYGANWRKEGNGNGNGRQSDCSEVSTDDESKNGNT